MRARPKSASLKLPVCWIVSQSVNAGVQGPCLVLYVCVFVCEHHTHVCLVVCEAACQILPPHLTPKHSLTTTPSSHNPAPPSPPHTHILLTVLADEHVVGLDVPVQHPVAVAGLQRLEQHQHVGLHVRGGQHHALGFDEGL